MGEVLEWPYSIEPVIDNDILNFFSENEWLQTLCFPVNSDIIVFDVDGLGLAPSSITMGFYFSPEDQPAWIDSEQLRPYGLKTGQYMNYPMLQEGNGWVPDKSVLDAEEDSILETYVLYTERICENFFYFESEP